MNRSDLDEGPGPSDGSGTAEPGSARRQPSWPLIVVGVVAAVFALGSLQDVIIPVVLSLLAASALLPLVKALVGAGVPRFLATAFVIGGLVAGLSYSALSLRDEATAVIAQAPEAARKLRLAMRTNRSQEPGSLEKVQQAARELEQTANEATGPSTTPRGVTRVQVEEPLISMTGFLWTGSLGLIGLAGQAIIVLFMTFVLCLSGDAYKRKLVEVGGPTFASRRLTVQILDAIDLQISRFLLVQVAANLAVAIMTALALWWIGLEQPFVWGLVAGVMNTIPYLGPMVVTVALAGFAMVQFGTVGMTLAVVGIALTITTLEGFVLTPFLVRQAGGLNQLTVFVGVLFWTWLWGPWGALLAVPMMMALKAVCDHIDGLQPIGELLSD
jgi:predicted PurR-regulated permease PerM